MFVESLRLATRPNSARKTTPTPTFSPRSPAVYPPDVPHIVVASDSAHVREEVKAVLSLKDTTVREVSSGAEVLGAVNDQTPDLLVCDLQMGNMGGMATCLELRLEESGGRLPHIPVLMLLDRRPDVFLARRSQAEGWVIKPTDPMRMRRAIEALLAGDTYHDTSYLPTEVEVSAK